MVGPASRAGLTVPLGSRHLHETRVTGDGAAQSGQVIPPRDFNSPESGRVVVEELHVEELEAALP